MFERISNSFALARNSWEVLKQNKRLILFPVISGLACLVVLVSFAIPLVILHNNGVFDGAGGKAQTPIWVYPVAFAFYFCNYFIITFCNAALVSCTLMYFNGEEPTVGDGFRAASARLPQIIAWSLVSATVGLLLRSIESAHEKVGAFIRSLLGSAWAIITYFVVPVLVVEKVGPIDAIKRSVSLLKKSWGEALIGRIGIGFFMFLVTLPGVLLLVGGFLAVANGTTGLGLALAGLGLVYLLCASAVGSALSTIFLSATYQYAAYETVPRGYDEEVIRGAFWSKKR
jgi:hypothetical protein